MDFTDGVMLTLLSIVLIVSSVLVSAWAIATLWIWFLVPLGLPVIGYAHALGINLMMTVFTQDFNTKSEESDDKVKKFVTQIVKAILFPVIFVGIGWIYHSFM